MRYLELAAVFVLMFEFNTSHLGAQEVFSLDPASVESRAKALREGLVRSKKGADSKIERETTVQALVEIVEAYPRQNKDRELLTAAIHELGFHPESYRARRCLFRVVDIQPFGRANADPLTPYPAALALVRVGSHARDAILRSRVPLTPQRLHLFAHILARIERTLDDYASGRMIAMFRITREIERLNAEPVAPELEEAKKHGIANLRGMLNLLSDPGFLAIEIPLPPEPAAEQATNAQEEKRITAEEREAQLMGEKLEGLLAPSME